MLDSSDYLSYNLLYHRTTEMMKYRFRVTIDRYSIRYLLPIN